MASATWFEIIGDPERRDRHVLLEYLLSPVVAALTKERQEELRRHPRSLHQLDWEE